MGNCLHQRPRVAAACRVPGIPVHVRVNSKIRRTQQGRRDRPLRGSRSKECAFDILCLVLMPPVFRWFGLVLVAKATQLCLGPATHLSVGGTNHRNLTVLTAYRPILLNSAMGFLSTLLNVYSMQHGHWSVTAITTASVIGLWLLISAVSSSIYHIIMPPLEPM